MGSCLENGGELMKMSFGILSFFQIITILATVSLYLLAIWALILLIKALNIYIRNNQ